jgi:hypothetical protein
VSTTIHTIATTAAAIRIIGGWKRSTSRLSSFL